MKSRGTRIAAAVCCSGWFGNQEYMNSSLLQFSRGFLYGSAVGAALLTFGLVAWGIALVTGVERDDSTHGMSLLPVYVLSFGLGGGIVGTLTSARSGSIKALFAWPFAVIIVLSGCFFIASFIVSREPVDWVWGASSGAALFLAAILAIASATLKRK